MADLHPLDESLALEARGPDLWHSPSSPLYWNAIGPFGRWSDDGRLLAQTQQLAWFADKPLRPL